MPERLGGCRRDGSAAGGMSMAPTIRSVILAGGSGTRLWPASRQSHPKQLLAVTGPYSLLQETIRRLHDFTAAIIDPRPIVVTNEEYRFVVADQLRQIGIEEPLIVLEPVGRNTAPALTLAAILTAEERELTDTGAADDTPTGTRPECVPSPLRAAEPVLLVMASDHLITNLSAFHAAVAEGAQHAEEDRLVTFGIVPDRPDTGYGYIRVGDRVPGAATARSLDGFTEKPDGETARRYLDSGQFLWNSGMFMTKSSTWFSALNQSRPDITAACHAALGGASHDGVFLRLEKNAFEACPSDSIDYAVMERLGARAIGGTAVVVPLDAGWSDVGEWGTLWSVSPKDEHENVAWGPVILEETHRTLVHADSRLVTVLGADDLVVIETADAVLVAGRENTQDLKNMVARVRDHDETLTLVHRRVHRPWGSFDCIDRGERFQVKRIVVSPGAALSLQLHRHRAEHWVVVEGVAEVTRGDDVFRLKEDESIYVPVNTPHRLANPGPGPLEVIEVQSGDYLGEDDIVRLEDSYGRMNDH